MSTTEPEATWTKGVPANEGVYFCRRKSTQQPFMVQVDTSTMAAFDDSAEYLGPITVERYDSNQQEIGRLRDGIQEALNYLAEEQRRSVFEHSSHDEANTLLAERLRSLLKKE